MGSIVLRRNRAAWRVSFALALLGCGSAPSQAPATPAVVDEGPTPGSADISADGAERCIEAASPEPFVPFVAPTGGGAFRTHMAGRVGELRCCFTEARRASLVGAGFPLRVAFEGRSADVGDGAVGRLVEPSSADHPEERRCLSAIVGGWVMTPAPRSDVVRPGAPSRPPSVVIAWSLRSLDAVVE